MMKPYFQDDTTTLYLGDCLEVMKEIEAGSVDCAVTSPPYDNLRQYGGHNWEFEPTANEIMRLMVNGGLVCWNVGDAVEDGSETLTSFRQAIYFKDVVGFNVHDTMIYEKPNFSHPEKSRYHQIFEYVFILAKGKLRCFNPIIDKKNSCAGTGSLGRHTIRESDGSMGERDRKIVKEYGMRGNVWKCKTAAQENVCVSLGHPAVMSYSLARDHVLSWSNPSDIVLDPFCGSGTTGVACVQTGRNFIGIEIEERYCEIAAKRIVQAKQQGRMDFDAA